MFDNYPIGVTNDDWQESVTVFEEDPELADKMHEDIMLGLIKINEKDSDNL